MKKKILFPIIIAFLSFAILAPVLMEVANATYIFSDGFESNTLNSWNKTMETGFSINTQTVNTGIYSAENKLAGGPPSRSGEVENLCFQALSSISDPMYFREYVYINSTTVPTTNGDYYEVGGFSTSTGGNIGDGEICVFNVGGTLYWGLYYRDAIGSLNPSGFTFSISNDNQTSDAHPVSIGWNCVELKQHVGVSVYPRDGTEQLFVNGNSVLDVFSSNWDRTPANVVIGGSQNVLNIADRWNYYIDDVVVSNAYIGPLQMQLTTSTNFGTVTPANGTFFGEGESVPLVATPPAAVSGVQYVWQGWNGTGLGSYTGMGSLSNDGVSYTASVTMNGNISETASWLRQYQLTIVTSEGTAIGSGSWFNENSVHYAAVTPLTVGNTQNSSVPIGTQYVFTGWSGDASGTNSPSNAIIMNGPKTAIADWKTQYMLTADSAQGTVTGAGWQDAGTSATVALNSLIVPGTIGTQYLFTGWSTDASGTTLTSNPITVDGPKTATANWQTQYNLTFAQSGVGSDFSGSVMTINGTSYGKAGFSTWANASDVYTFNYVSSPIVVNANSKQYILTGVSGNTTALSLTASKPTSLTGAYKTQYYLTVTSTYATASPTNGWYDNGTSITDFVASPVSGGTGTQYVCTGWSGTGSIPASGSSSAVTFAISAPSTIAWTWKTQYLVTFNVTPSNGGTTNPSGTNVWEDTTPISISASPYGGYTFSSWSTDTGNITVGYQSSASSTATINGPGTLTANFATAPNTTPTPTPIHTATPTNSPTPTAHPTSTPTATPTNSSTTTPTGETNSGFVVYLSVIVVVVVIAAVAGSVIVLRKRKKK